LLVPERAVVVLGCAVWLDARGRLGSGALSRRLDAAARAYADGAGSPTVVVASGGRRWGDAVEADVMALELRSRGVPERAVVRERCSLSTAENARFSAAILARRGIRQAAIVTCAWHLARATALFRRAGVDVVAIPAADGGPVPWSRSLWRGARERALLWWELSAEP
jgi:uncharacterized SAM-binding protein YcdF (DUF218 family)